MTISVISQEQSRELLGALSHLLAQIKADVVLLTDTGGNILANTESPRGADIQTMAALSAGSFMATRQLAVLLGEPAFYSIFHQGQQTSIYIRIVGKDHLLIILFGRGTTAGLVKLHVEMTAIRIEPILSKAGGQNTAEAGGAGVAFELDPSARIFETNNT